MLSESQKKLSLYFKNAVSDDSVRQAYIIEGDEGIGKGHLVSIISKYLMCETGQACDVCTSCKSLAHGANPDCCVINNGEKKVIELQKIRDMIKEAYIKPVMGKYKLFIIKNAHLLDAPGQNALLKLIEEPPCYAVFILVCNNLNTILPTIISRSVVLKLEPWSQNDLKAVCPLPEADYYMYNYCLGNIGTLIDISSNEEFKQLRNGVIDTFTKMILSDEAAVYNAVDFWNANKESKENIISILVMFLRDVVFYKSNIPQSIANSDKIKEIQNVSDKISFRSSFDMMSMAADAPRQLGKYGNFTMHAQSLLIQLKKLCTQS